MHTTISGLDAGAAATVTATLRDTAGRPWSSRAVFTADGDGRVSLDQPATGGSYRGADPMGLIETLRPISGTASGPAGRAFSRQSGGVVTLSVSVDGRRVATTTVRRDAPAQHGVTDQPLTLAANGILGDLYSPPPTAHPGSAVLIFGGSEGGQSTAPQAATLAAHGHPTLALTYFRAPGLPPTLNSIPLEYFATALTYLDTRPGVDPRHTTVIGASRGSEAALLLGAHFPTLVHNVIATSPSSVVNPGYPDGTRPAWSLAGQPLPRIPAADYRIPDPFDAPRAVIPVAAIPGTLTLVCGEVDHIWPSCPYTNTITSHRPHQPTTVLRYPHAGHLVDYLLPYIPDAAPDSTYLTTGGSSLADTQADAQAWPHILTILHTA